MYHCFKDDLQSERLDRSPFKFGHKLLGHPALTLENLARALPALPREQVMYSKGLLKNGDDFETTFSRRPKDRTIEETIEAIRTTDSFIMVRSPEVDASFATLYRELIADVELLMRERGVGTQAIDAQLYLFIASPNSITPFHIDRYSTFLMQFRGSKQICVFEPWDDRVVNAPNREAYVARENTRLPWSPDVDPLATSFQFSPGEALHIPFVSGHHVRNGSEDVSISMSIIFNTEESMRWRRALAFNHTARKYLQRMGMRPAPVGAAAWRDATKSGVWRSYVKAKSMLSPPAS